MSRKPISKDAKNKQDSLSMARRDDEAVAQTELAALEGANKKEMIGTGAGEADQLKPENILAYQQIVGNQAVGNMLGQPDSKKTAELQGASSFHVDSLMRGRSPAYLQIGRTASRDLYRKTIRKWQQSQSHDDKAGFRIRLVDTSNQPAISQSPLQQIRRMAREPDRMVEDLSTLDNYLNRADQVVGVGVGAADVFDSPNAARRLRSARGAIRSVRAPISRATEVLEQAQNVNEIVSAIQELEGMDIRQDRRAAARAFDRLFTNIGELGESIPGIPPPVAAYFTLLSNVGTFFSDMVRIMDPMTRPGAGGRELRAIERGDPQYTSGPNVRGVQRLDRYG